MAVEEKAKAIKYKVERHGPGGIDVVHVTAESGDEAALKAYKAGCVIRGVTPDQSDADENTLAAERDEQIVEDRAEQTIPSGKAAKAAADLQEKSDKDVADRKVPPYV
jgi:hypothetical protein